MEDQRMMRIHEIANKYGYSMQECLDVFARILDYTSMRYCGIDMILDELDAELAIESFERDLSKMYIY